MSLSIGREGRRGKWSFATNAHSIYRAHATFAELQTVELIHTLYSAAYTPLSPPDLLQLQLLQSTAYVQSVA